MPDQTILSFKRLISGRRRARGIPDSGIPKYVKDEDILGTYPIPSDTLHPAPGAEPALDDGRGSSQSSAPGTMALVTQGANCVGTSPQSNMRTG
jgi:hypothetical protein